MEEYTPTLPPRSDAEAPSTGIAVVPGAEESDTPTQYNTPARVEAFKRTGLDERQAALVIELSVRGDMKAAARAAGVPPSLGEQWLATSEPFQDALLSAIEGLKARDLLVARKVISDLALAGKTEPVRFKAAQLLIDHAIGKPVERHAHIHEHRVRTPADFKQLAMLIRAKSRELGLNDLGDAQRAIATEPHTPVVDAEFSAAPSAPEAAPYTPAIPTSTKPRRRPA